MYAFTNCIVPQHKHLFFVRGLPLTKQLTCILSQTLALLLIHPVHSIPFFTINSNYQHCADLTLLLLMPQLLLNSLPLRKHSYFAG